jgi:glucose-6-phosphate isomerase
MITVETNLALPFVSDEEQNLAARAVKEASMQLDNRTGKGTEWLGWQDILREPNDALLENMESIGREIHKHADVFIICGIGGSYLGARAVIEALTPEFSDSGPEIIYAGHHISGRYLKQLIEHLEKPKPDGTPKQVFLNVISKSGTTMETAIAFRFLRKWMHDHYGDDAVSRIFCTTSREGGALNRIVSAHGYRKFILPDDVGGRFSVLTPVGLLPIAASGIDVKRLFYGAVESYGQLQKDRSNLLDYVTARHALYKKGYAIDLISTFEPSLVSMGGWLQQLYGESEGKNGQGLFPVVAQYSTDLHSLGQMVQDGKRNILETFLHIRNAQPTLVLSDDLRDYDGLNYLSGKSMEEVNGKAFEGTVQAHNEGGVPVFKVFLDKQDPETIGHAIYFFELATAIFVYSLGENPFDQPGVEDYKKAMYRLLGKQDG